MACITVVRQPGSSGQTAAGLPAKTAPAKGIDLIDRQFLGHFEDSSFGVGAGRRSRPARRPPTIRSRSGSRIGSSSLAQHEAARTRPTRGCKYCKSDAADPAAGQGPSTRRRRRRCEETGGQIDQQAQPGIAARLRQPERSKGAAGSRTGRQRQPPKVDRPGAGERRGPGTGDVAGRGRERAEQDQESRRGRRRPRRSVKRPKPGPEVPGRRWRAQPPAPGRPAPIDRRGDQSGQDRQDRQDQRAMAPWSSRLAQAEEQRQENAPSRRARRPQQAAHRAAAASGCAAPGSAERGGRASQARSSPTASRPARQPPAWSITGVAPQTATVKPRGRTTRLGRAPVAPVWRSRPAASCAARRAWPASVRACGPADLRCRSADASSSARQGLSLFRTFLPGQKAVQDPASRPEVADPTSGVTPPGRRALAGRSETDVI